MKAALLAALVALAAAPARAGLNPTIYCHCWCGRQLAPPCGDADCARVCGLPPGARRRAGPALSAQDQAVLGGAAALGGALGSALGGAIGQALRGGGGAGGGPAAGPAVGERVSGGADDVDAVRRGYEWDSDRPEAAPAPESGQDGKAGSKEASPGELVGGAEPSQGAQDDEWERQVLEDRARRDALKRLRGKPEEEWCKLHFFQLRRPARPLVDPGGQYAGMVARYKAHAREWDERCGGPGAAPAAAPDAPAR